MGFLLGWMGVSSVRNRARRSSHTAGSGASTLIDIGAEVAGDWEFGGSADEVPTES
jgi:hypothetical protein